MVELVDMSGLDSDEEIRVSSSLTSRMTFQFKIDIQLLEQS